MKPEPKQPHPAKANLAFWGILGIYLCACGQTSTGQTQPTISTQQSIASVTPLNAGLSTSVVATPTNITADNIDWLQFLGFTNDVRKSYKIHLQWYSVNSAGQLQTTIDWTGVAVEHIVSIQHEANVDYMVVSEIVGLPEFGNDDHVDLKSESFQYEISGLQFKPKNGPYILTGYEQLNWPLEPGQHWGQSPVSAAGPDVGLWRVVEKLNYQGQNTIYRDCIHLEQTHNTGANVIWLCPNFGLVHAEEFSTSAAYNETWDLLPNSDLFTPNP